MKNIVLWAIKTQFVLHLKNHYFSATVPSRLLLCKILGYHGGYYRECHLLGCGAMWGIVRSDFPEERVASILRVETISELPVQSDSYC
jgi:hypothetical protein